MRTSLLLTFSLSLSLSIAGAACKRGESSKPAEVAPKVAPSPAVVAPPPAAAPAAAAPAAPGAAQVAIMVPKSATSFAVPNADVEVADAGKDAAWFKERLGDGGDGTFVDQAKLGDGWVVRYKDSDDHLRSAVYRTVAGVTLLCQTRGDDQAQNDLGAASCRGLGSPDGTSFLVPFAVTSDEVPVEAGVSLAIALADADSPKDIAGETENAQQGLKILKQAAVPGGFAVAYQAYNGGIAKQGNIYRAAVRLKAGSADVRCSAWGSPKDADEALRAMAACTSLRAP